MSDLKFWDVFRDPLWLLHNFHRKYKHIRVPTNAGWSTSNVNGGVTQQPMRMYENTSITASSRGMGFCQAQGLNSGGITHTFIDWTKRLELSFILSRTGSDAEAVGRIQLKEINTEGVFAAKGIGLQISNYTVVGEAYGTARSTTGTLNTLTINRIIRVKIVKRDTSVDFYVNEVLVESLTGTAVPATAGAADGYLVFSLVNGVTGGIDVYQLIANIEVVQAW